ncbi:aminotransferase class IV family protein [Pseudaminobacter sp. NGMCC 1.201702]|uniref:aminotransferase class IV family protein n=1 Tax=Pseudaminobacter sp. NGMCC 1.201702 TaxID=3391825 RepID=UPI0039EFFBAE
MSAQGPVRDRDTADFELIETLRWEPSGGFVRLERHLARLAASARELGFAYSEMQAQRALDAVALGDSALRVRLTLDATGTTDVTTQAFSPLAADTVWTLGIASTRLDAADPLLRHKTTRRQAYEAARAEFPREIADEVILRNHNGEICEGTITTIFADFGDTRLLTPPLGCGLLAGVLRAELLDEGKAVEAVLTPSDLRQARALFVGNSLRGLITARLG